MKILIVNDDSIYAPGIALLAKAAVELGEVTVVAPAQQCSALSQKLTLRESMTLEQMTDFPVAVQAAWKLGGTPVDCVKVALKHLMPEKPDFVFSGINNGYNAGFDIAYSGTLGAAFEAARSGVPAIAFSAASEKHLEAVEGYLQPVIRELMEAGIECGLVWNVNFPSMKEGAPKGILRNRTAAEISMFRETYVKNLRSDGTVELSCKGIPTETEKIPTGTDAEAVRKGYISIGKVRAF
ncbi:MAG: 5'/3'-nucleotidase SurE [Oscillospiraceae bacterium]|nr:5'/3'-nucleotidase SurE [Oscillospiraceae bacterium]